MDDFGGVPWQGKPKGGYWLPKEFHTWPELRSVRLAELGLFVDLGIWSAGFAHATISANVIHGERRPLAAGLLAHGLWSRSPAKSYRTKTMAELRMGRGTRGLIFRFSRMLAQGAAAAAAGYAALGVYALAASWSLTSERPGYIPTETALQFGKRKHVVALWDSGMWRLGEHGFCMDKGTHPLEARWALARDDQRAAIPDDVRARVMETFGHRCAECGAVEDLALDHIYPWSLGGPDTEDNLQVLCRPCNSAKGAKVKAKGDF